MFSRSPIRRKLMAVEMLTVVCALLLACAGFIISDIFQLRLTKLRDLQTLAEITALDSTAALTFSDREAATELLSAFRVKPSVESARVYDAKGEPFASYVQNPQHGFVPPPQAPSHPILNLRRIEVVQPIELKGRRIGTIYVSANLNSVNTQIIGYIKLSVVILAVALFTAFIVSFHLQRSISEPIVTLSHVVNRVSQQKDYTIRAPMIEGRNEIGNLIAGFNGMLGEIQLRDEELLRHRSDLEREVAVRTAQVKRILNTAGEGIFELDAEGKATFVNPSAARMFGWPAEELAGMRLHDVIHAADRDHPGVPFEACSICSSLLDPPLRAHTDSFNRREGNPMPVEYTSNTIIYEDGTRGGVVVTFRDISERLVVDRMKSEFVSTVSHELRTPLTSIRGALGLLAAGLLGNIAPKARRMLDIAISNTDRLVRLINDILDLERMDSGRVDLHPKLIDANDLMRQTVDTMQAMADRAGIRLVVEPRYEMVWADADRIVQLLTNLVSNAIKFAPPESSVTLSASARGQQLVFSVADQGRGIPSDKLDMIFERFKQVDASDSRDKGGTGLGLAICRSIAVAHGGRIWAESSEGKGSTFRFSIPLPAAALTAKERAPEASPVERTVLLCEEQGKSMTMVASMLQRHGLRTVYAASPQELCRWAAATHPDAVIFDLEESSSEGWRILERLKSCDATRGIPIIVAAMEQPESVEAHTKLIAGWVKKPYEEGELLQAVSDACSKPLILVVEDDLDLAGIMTTSFESHGIQTMHAPTGRAAIDMVVDRRPDLIVLDLILPEMDGFAVVDWLKKSNALAHIPLIVYSAMELDDAEQARLRLGPTEFLIKSRVSLEEFEGEVVRLLNLVTTEMEVEGAA